MTSSARNTAVALGIATLFGAWTAGSAQATMWSLFSGSSNANASGQDTGAATSSTTDPPAVVAQGPHFQDGSFTGQVFDAYYGRVQVKANISDGQIVSIDVLQFPQDRRTSRYINSQALPMLKSEVISAQSTRVDIISGATLTSEAFLRSLNTALKQARSS
jgi:uncharacterized protein with FMN-binding domain